MLEGWDRAVAAAAAVPEREEAVEMVPATDMDT